MAPISVLLVTGDTRSTDSLSAFLPPRADIVALDWARTSQEALDKARSLRPEVVLVDGQSRNIDVLEVTRALKHEPWAPRAIFVGADGVALREAAQAGADAGIVSPKVATELMRLIKTMFPPAPPSRRSSAG